MIARECSTQWAFSHEIAVAISVHVLLLYKDWRARATIYMETFSKQTRLRILQLRLQTRTLLRFRLKFKTGLTLQKIMKSVVVMLALVCVFAVIHTGELKHCCLSRTIFKESWNLSSNFIGQFRSSFYKKRCFYYIFVTLRLFLMMFYVFTYSVDYVVQFPARNRKQQILLEPE